LVSLLYRTAFQHPAAFALGFTAHFDVLHVGATRLDVAVESAIYFSFFARI
jgi:hypothetical protein